MKTLIQEYRPSMNIEVLHSWAKDIIEEMKQLQQSNQELQRKYNELVAARISYANLFDGEVDDIHQNIRELKQKNSDLEKENQRLLILEDKVDDFLHKNPSQQECFYDEEE